MRLLTLAAGLATGYVLGTRAGRGKYEQIVEGARQLRANPTFAQAQATAKKLASSPPTASITPPAASPAMSSATSPAMSSAASSTATASTRAASNGAAAKPKPPRVTPGQSAPGADPLK
ncbi:hypothetical protein AB0J72_36245 [Dactylosporangium sp. NPDC049742]|uniref:hypothetical protein n=1 Tax=Dactylosporangium sp. NPDC049742 TaxID=3154737 RepID=UPI003448D10C